MGITGGFGTTIDLGRGTSRQWVIGRDGVKRWADSGEPVEKDEGQPVCGHCFGTGRMVRDPDIGTDQECFACDGTGANIDA